MEVNAKRIHLTRQLLKIGKKQRHIIINFKIILAFVHVHSKVSHVHVYCTLVSQRIANVERHFL